MKYLNQVILVCVLLAIMSCNKDELGSGEIPTEQKLYLKKEIVNGFETTNYEYDENNRLVKILYRSQNYNPITDESWIDTFETFIEYRDGRVDQIINSKEYQFSYEATDLLIEETENSNLRSQIIFENFTDENVSRIEAMRFYTNSIETRTMLVTINNQSNIVHVVDENQIPLEETTGATIGRIYPTYFGEMEYDDNPNPYANFSPELRLWLRWEKNPNNLTRRVMQDRIWEFEYEYNESGFPIRRSLSYRDPLTNLTSDPVNSRYVYELR